MALLQVRNFPDEIYGAIAKIAKQERRSVAQQTVLLIETGLNASGENILRRKRAIERTLERGVFADADKIDFAKMIREDRSR